MDDHDKIRKLRQLRGFKQEAMANALNISIRAYSKLENGQTALTTDRLLQISQVLEIEPDEIIAFCEDNIYRSCKHCSYRQLPQISDLSFLTERLMYQRQIKELNQKIAHLLKNKRESSREELLR